LIVSSPMSTGVRELLRWQSQLPLWKCLLRAITLSSFSLPPSIGSENLSSAPALELKPHFLSLKIRLTSSRAFLEAIIGCPLFGGFCSVRNYPANLGAGEGQGEAEERVSPGSAYDTSEKPPSKALHVDPLVFVTEQVSKDASSK